MICNRICNRIYLYDMHDIFILFLILWILCVFFWLLNIICNLIGYSSFILHYLCISNDRIGLRYLITFTFILNSIAISYDMTYD